MIPLIRQRVFQEERRILLVAPFSPSARELDALCGLLIWGREGRTPELLRSLRVYTADTAGIQRFDQCFLCYGGPHRAHFICKKPLSTGFSMSFPMHIGVRCHSTRNVAVSWVALEVFCAVAAWASPGTFSRFYGVNVATSAPKHPYQQGRFWSGVWRPQTPSE